VTTFAHASLIGAGRVEGCERASARPLAARLAAPLTRDGLISRVIRRGLMQRRSTRNAQSAAARRINTV
jgi:hypothetical protein